MKIKRIALLTGGFVATAAAALAHPGHGPANSFAGGILHPLTGWDHIFAMVAVGMWAAQLRSRLVVAAAFIVAMIVGAALGHRFGAIGPLEQGIVASVFCLGVLIASSAQLPVVAAAGLTAVFAVFHGWAHGAEMAGGAGAAAYGVGFVVATVGLIAAGMLTARLAQARVLRWAGAGLMLASVVLAIA